LAVEEMLERTETEWGPWTIVEATDRRWARVKIFQTIIRRLEEALKERGLKLPPEEMAVAPQPGEGEDENDEALDADLTAEVEAQVGEE